MDVNQNNDFKRIQSKANIVEIISSYVKLENHGRNYFGVCPFHDDHSPSMSVSEDKQIYKCFVCGATGNVFTFVQNYLGVNFIEAVKIVAEKIGENFVVYKSKEDIRYEKYYNIMNLSSLFYENNLRTPLGEEARKYLHDRGLTDEIIKDFSIGLSLEDNNKLYTLLKNKKISDKDMLDLGLIANGGDGPYDLFRNRIIFPLKSKDGKVNGFSGRIYNSKSNSKYINTKETVIFKKRENLYNYHLAAPEARKEKFIVICEGFMDAIRIYSIGIHNVVATMGTALAKEQIELLKKLNVKIIIVMDSDDAGEMATINIGQSLMKENMDIGVVRLTGKKDPDEYILKYGGAAFKDNIKNPMNYPEFMLKSLRKNKDLSNPTILTKYINDVVNMISASPDNILIEVTLNKLAEEFHLNSELLKTKVINKESFEEELKTVDKKVIEEKKETKVSNKFTRALVTMLYYMMNSTDCMRLFLREDLELPKNKYRPVANNLIYYFELNKEIDFADYLSFSENYVEVYPVVKEIIQNVSQSKFTEEDMKSVLSIVKKSLMEEKIKIIKEEIRNELDVNRRKRLFEKIIEIKRGCVENNEE